MHGNTFERFLKAEEEANRASMLALDKYMYMFEGSVNLRTGPFRRENTAGGSNRGLWLVFGFPWPFQT
jgi:hypothetical protein